VTAPAAGSPASPPPDSIPIGEIGVAQGCGVLRMLVGSCVALVLHAAHRRACGVAHVMLPASTGRGTSPGKYADTAVAETLRLLQEVTQDPGVSCTAKLVGGAAMFAFRGGVPIGEQNVAALERILGERGIEIVGRDCGGGHGRRVIVDVATGAVTVATAEHGTQTL
jgi:chemotaxis protein CheD